MNNERYEVEIFDLSYEGAGVGRLMGKIIFVPKTLPNEKVIVEIVKTFSSFYIGKVVEFLSKSEFRGEPLCPYFGVCGGCDFQECSYEAELNFKKNILKKELSKVEEVQDVEVVSVRRFSYRNKVKFVVHEGKLGFFKAKSHDFFEVLFCPIASEKINAALPKVREFLSDNTFEGLRNVYLKEGENALAVCLLFDRKMFKNCEKIKKNAKNLQKLDDFLVFFAFGDVLESDKTKIVPLKKDRVFQKKYAEFFAPLNISAFNQVNDMVAEKLYAYVCQKTEGLKVLNAYSGQGLLTRLIAKNAAFVYGIEYQVSAHESAEKLLEKIDNAQNICGLVENEISGVLERDCVDLVVLDPPREGCAKNVILAIKTSKIAKILYISCNFSTLTRDLSDLKDNYSIKEVKLFDMFPCTKNMETAVLLERR